MQAVEAAHHLTDAVPPWDALLSSARQFIGGDSATFIVFDPTGGLVVTRQQGVAPEAEREYIQHYHAHDVMTARTQEAAPGTWFDSASMPSQGLQVGERDYLDYMHRHRMRQMVGLIAIRSPRLQGGFTIQRSNLHAGAADWAERPDVRLFSSAIQSGLARLHRQRQDWVTHAQGALEAFGDALCILTPQGRILHASAAAEALLGSGRGLCARQGVLWHPDERVRQQWAAALQSAVRLLRPCSLALHDASGQVWVYADLTIAPAWTGLGGQAPVLMRLRPVPPGDQTEFQRRLASAFALTPSEARVLDGLVNGQSAAEQASRHGLSINTVRTQIASLRHKMGCKRQVDLVRKALQWRA